MGYYGGAGARKVATVSPSATLPQTQPACLTDAATGLIDCGNWAVSGVVGGAGQRGVRHLLRQAGATTTPAARATSCSSCATTRAPPTCCSRPPTRPGRPTTTTAATASTPARPRAAPTRSATTGRSTRASVDNGQDWLFNAEYPMVRWLEANGYDVSYFTGVDTDRRGALILNHKVFLSVGHDEYWSGAAARQRRGRARRRRQPRVLQRQRGVLEDALGEQHRRLGHALPHAGLLQGDARQREDRSQPRRGPARGAIRASARPPTAAGRRTR